MAVHLNHSHPSYQAVFALDVLTAAAALVLLALATGPTFTRLKSRRFSVPNKSHDTPLKTSLGTYLFLWPGLFCFFLAYTFQFIADILETSGGSSINYNGGLGLHGRLPFSSANGTSNVYTISILSFTTALATIFFSVLINGGVWIYSSHITNNSTGQAAPSLRSKIWNTIILLAILITGFAAWCCGMATRSRLTTWSEIVHMNDATRIIFVLYRCVVIVASVSVSVEVLRRYLTVRANSESNKSGRTQLAIFAMVSIPLIWTRNIFMIYDVVLIFVESMSWSTSSILASQFLLIIFGQIANLSILGITLYGAWQTGKTVQIFDSDNKA